MALSLQLGFPDVPKSVTNPSVYSTDALDVSSPLSFLSFIKIINASFEPDTLQGYYNYYLKTWNNQSSSKPFDDNELIIQNYKDFLKELSLNHTTPEEKTFLSLMDFNDPYDLDVSLRFYSKKLRELSEFYNNKRQDVKYGVVRNKLKGTTFGSEKTISELTLSHLKNLDDSRILFDIESIKASLEIEIEELYDTYPLYFNRTPNTSVYDAKDLDYGLDIFLKTNTELISEVFADLSEEIKIIKESDELFDNKRALTETYISTDFYYLSTGSMVDNIEMGKLFSSKYPSKNFRNRDYPTTASTEVAGYLKTPRELGFFKPNKASIVTVDGFNGGFDVNYDNLIPNTVYYFPDPEIFGKNGDILTFIVDDSFLKKNFSSGNAVNQPVSKKGDTKYQGYISKSTPNHSKYLDEVFESGFIQDIKRDLYNNTFGLFKNDHRFRKTIETVSGEDVYNVIINGHSFYDRLYWEGYTFDYTIPDNTTFDQTIRSGLSSNTNGFLNNVPEVTLYFGKFTPYNEVIAPTDANLSPSYVILEGAYLTKSNLSFYPDAVSSDLSAFETSTGSFYYSDLIEGGINTVDPLQRALYDTSLGALSGSLSANLIEYTTTSAFNVYDGGHFLDGDPFDTSIEPDNYYFVDSSDNLTTFTLSTTPYSDDYALNGKIFIKNVSDKYVYSLSAALPYLTSKYSSEIIDEMNENVTSFDIANDVLFIETPSYLTINKISMQNGDFVDPKSIPYALSIEGDYTKISNRFKKDYNVYYCRLSTTSQTISSNNFIVYPEIYEFDLINFKNTKIFPKTSNDITSFFDISGGNVRYTHVDKPTFNYNSRNNIYNISYLLKDQNDMPVLHRLDFTLDPNVLFTTHDIRTFNTNYTTSNILSSGGTLNMFLSGGSISYVGEELTL